MQIKTIVESDSKYRRLKRDPDIARWLRNLERGSKVTAEVSVRRLGKACELLSLSPQELIAEAHANPKLFQDKLEDIVSSLEKNNKAGIQI